ncbi:36801_t:CDS:2 [Gigaspora margarita]|uniref:36801_t:CDS:1 n=1 Tax=Gigaspora margarita TaxID=4874 RepID=A0ABN7VAQ1_GIGMA|nr:36801_t:CDS:2 [Gigaspora margarita]
MEFLLEVKDLFKQVFQALLQIDVAHDQVSLQRYDYFNYKQSCNQSLSKEEATFLEGLLHEQDKDNNIQTNTKKLLLETLECGTTDYRTEEIQNKLIQESLSKEITKKTNQTNKCKTQDSGSPVNSATIVDTRKKTKTNMPDIFEGKLLRTTLGEFDKAILNKKKEIKAILQNLSKTAKEITLLRQLKAFKVKGVFIPNNSNSNQHKIAMVLFDSLQNLQDTTRSKIYYYNTKLLWKENILVREAKIRIPEIVTPTSYSQPGEIEKKKSNQNRLTQIVQEI